MAFPLAVQALINNIAFTGLTQSLIFLTLILFVVLSASVATQMLQLSLMERLQCRTYVRSVAGVTAFLNTLEGSKKIPDLKKFAEITSVQKGFVKLWVEGLDLLLRLFAGLIVLMFYHPSFAFLSLLVMILAAVVVQLGRRQAVNFASEECAAKYEWIEHTAREPNAYTEDPLRDQASINYLEARRSHFRVYYLQSFLIYMVAIFAGAALVALGGYLVLKEALTVGELVASEMITGSIIFSLFKVPKFIEVYYDFEASLGKLASIFDEPLSLERRNRRVFRSFQLAGTGTTRRIAGGLAVTVVLVCSILFLPWTQTSLGQGRVVGFTPDQRPQTIEATVSGRVSEWKVSEGAQVTKGEVLVRLEDIDPQALRRLEEQRSAIEKQIDSIRINRRVAKANLDRQVELLKEGIVSQRELELSENEVAKVSYEEGVILGKLSEIDLKIARQSAQHIVAPVSGFISRVHGGQGGELLKPGDPLLTIVPQLEDKVLEIWVDGNDAPLWQKGQQARIQLEGWPAFVFSGWPDLGVGTFPARVRLVDQSETDGKFRVLLEDHSGLWPDARFLRQGTRAIGMITLGEVSVGYELWRKINGFPVLPSREILAERNSSRKGGEKAVTSDSGSDEAPSGSKTKD
jgi:multidrug resistance efflux pump